MSILLAVITANFSTVLNFMILKNFGQTIFLTNFGPKHFSFVFFYLQSEAQNFPSKILKQDFLVQI